MFALKAKGKNTFSCWATTEERLNERVKSAYNNWLGYQPKGSNKTMKDFMSGVVKVEVLVRELKAEDK